ncbi:MarR family winged helix-turn-helix transcriptional regulator [Acidiphilium sp. AL]|nr:MarR family transcriptional regulator [Acidiphilium sp. AL]
MRLELDRRARLHGMNRAQWAMLLKLARHPGLSQKDLAELLEVEPMTVARLTDRLEARGLVERRADPNDRRIWRLHLKPAAEPVLHEVDAQRAAVAAVVTHDLPAETIRTMIRGLILMKAALISPECSVKIQAATKAQQEMV